MTRIPLKAALAALDRDIGRDLPDRIAAGEIHVDLCVVVSTDGKDVRWEVVEADTPSTHRIRLVMRRPQPSPEAADLTDVLIGDDLDSSGYADLPPIVRPKPGLDQEPPYDR